MALVNAGMSAIEALVAATRNGAEALGVENQVGSIKTGKRADLLVVDPDPLDDIEILQHKQNIKMIMKNGEIFRSRL